MKIGIWRIMLDNKGFDLWADGYDKSVGVSEEDNTYPFAGYKKILGSIYETIMKKPNAVVVDIGFGNPDSNVLFSQLYLIAALFQHSF